MGFEMPFTTLFVCTSVARVAAYIANLSPFMVYNLSYKELHSLAEISEP